MNKMPLEIADKICEYLPLEDCLSIIGLNGRFAAATTHQFKQRATPFNLSFVNNVHHPSSIRNMIEHILPHIRTMVVNVPQTRHVQLCIKMCTNVESITFKNNLVRWCDYKLSGVKTLEFRQVSTSDEAVQSYLKCCSDELNSLVIEETFLSGLMLDFVPKSVRRLHIIDSISDAEKVIDYLWNNPNIEDFFLEIDHLEAGLLPQLLANLGQVRKLGLIGYGLRDKHQYDQLAQLCHLVELHIEICNENFCQYPQSIVEELQQLKNLNIAMDEFVVSPEFAASFTKFRSITKMTINIGQNLKNAQLLVRPIVLLAQRAKLESLVLAGFTEYLDIAANRSMFEGLKEFRVCATGCDCADHLHRR